MVEMGELLAPRQLGYGVGKEAGVVAVNAARLSLHDLDQTEDWVKLGFKNTFNYINRY